MKKARDIKDPAEPPMTAKNLATSAAIAIANADAHAAYAGLPTYSELVEALRQMQPLIDIAFCYEGDVFGSAHNDAADATVLGRDILARIPGSAA